METPPSVNRCLTVVGCKVVFDETSGLLSLSVSFLVFQGEESPGYEELTAAAKRVDSVPVAICTVKEVWAHYQLSSDTITLFRKVLHTISFIHNTVLSPMRNRMIPSVY